MSRNHFFLRIFRIVPVFKQNRGWEENMSRNSFFLRFVPVKKKEKGKKEDMSRNHFFLRVFRIVPVCTRESE